MVKEKVEEFSSRNFFKFNTCFHSAIKPDCPSCCVGHASRMERQLRKLEESTALPLRDRVEKVVREQMTNCYQVYKGVPPDVDDWVGGALHYVMWGIERDLPLPAPNTRQRAERAARRIYNEIDGVPDVPEMVNIIAAEFEK